MANTTSIYRTFLEQQTSIKLLTESLRLSKEQLESCQATVDRGRPLIPEFTDLISPELLPGKVQGEKTIGLNPVTNSMNECSYLFVLPDGSWFYHSHKHQSHQSVENELFFVGSPTMWKYFLEHLVSKEVV